MSDPADGPGDIGAANQRLLRIDGDRGLSLSEKLGAGLRHLTYRTPLHRMRLRGRYPLRLLAVPVDPIQGDPAVGERIVAGRLPWAGHNPAAVTLAFDDRAAPLEWQDWAQGFGWLRDLAAAAPRAQGARVAEPLVSRWLSTYGDFDVLGWRADLLGRRLLYWSAYAPYILSSADHVYRSAVLNAMARWARHLDRAASRLPDGMARIEALAGLVAAGLLIAGGEARLARAEPALADAVDAVLLTDGGIVTRAPRDQLALLELLLFVEAVYRARDYALPRRLGAGIARLVPALKGVTMGDGVPGSWHGSSGPEATRVSRALDLGGEGVRAARHGAQSGYHRLAGGRTLLVADAGPPPVARVAAGAHAGTLAFELSDGPDRLVINCGGAIGLSRPLPADLAAGLRTTAAHSTLVLDDTNSTRIRPDGALGRGVEEVVANRQESEEGSWLDLTHDGYSRRHLVLHRRRLFLSADGNDLRGEDALEPLPGRRVRGTAVAVRFHLGIGVEPVPTADGQGALLRVDGRVWQFRARGGTLSIEASLWIGPDGRPRPTQQLVINGPATAEIAWSFKRAGK